jgi:hypothetical protein
MAAIGEGNPLTREFRTSSFSTGGNCVQVAFEDGSIVVRHSKKPDGATLAFNKGEWDAFVQGVCAGEFGVPSVTFDS